MKNNYSIQGVPIKERNEKDYDSAEFYSSAEEILTLENPRYIIILAVQAICRRNKKTPGRLTELIKPAPAVNDNAPPKVISCSLRQRLLFVLIWREQDVLTWSYPSKTNNCLS